MRSDVIRSGRVRKIYGMARTGKYTWAQLLSHAEATGVTRQTAKKYIDTVYAQLKKEGYLK